MNFGQGGPHGAPGDPQQPGPPPGPPPGPAPAPGGQPVPPAGQFGPPPVLLPQAPQQSQAPSQPQPQPMPQQPAPWGPVPGQDQGRAASQTPDWDALADTTASRGRRRKWLLIGGGALATIAVAGTVAALVVGSGKSGKAAGLPSPQKLPSSPGSPEPSFSQVAPPPPPNPRDFIASADKDKAPLSTKTLFPHSKPSLDKRKYDRTATTTDNDCASAAQGGLGAVLTGNGCREVLRATYVRDGVAVTVGVAVFDTKAAADKAKEQSTGNIESLAGDGPSFCRATACRLTANAEGRYAYFTVAGYTNGKAVPDDDKDALQAGRDVAGYTFRRIMARANAQAAASVAMPSPGAKKQA